MVREWATKLGLTLISLYNISIHQKGNALDLVFSNITGAEANVEDYLATGSDHQTLVTTLLSQFQAGRHKLNLSPDKSYAELLKTTLHKCLPPYPLTS